MGVAEGGSGAAGGGGFVEDMSRQAAAVGRHINAFTLEDVMEEKRVVCLEAWGQYLLIGLTDGTLLLASQRPTAAQSSQSSAAATATNSPASQWSVVQSLRGFGQGQVKQLQVAGERSMLLCLADDGVNAYVLPGLRLKGQAGRTRGASLFAWHGGSDTLAVATKRRLAFFKYDGLEFVFQRDAHLSDAPACMQLAGATLYVGLARREYVAVDVATGAVTQLFTTTGPAACLVAVSATEVMLARDSSSMLYGPDGRPLRRNGGSVVHGGSVDWAAAPAALAVSQPYVLALSEGGVEAGLLQPLSATDLRQQLPLELPSAATSSAVASSPAPDGSIFLASRMTGSVKRLSLVSFERQARQLLALGEHEEALAIAALLPPDQAVSRRQLEDLIHLSYGRMLFRQGQYEEAMAHFGMSGLAGPLQLLRLFPSLAPPRLLEAAAAEQGEEGAAAATSTDEIPAREVAGSAETGAGAAVEQASAAGAVPEWDTGEAAEVEPQGEARAAAVQVVMPYLLSHRSRLAAAAAASPARPRPANATESALDGAAPDGNSSHVSTPKAVSTAETAGSAAGAGTAAAKSAVPQAGPSPATRAALVQRQLEGNATAALLDTSLLLALLAMPDSGALLRFVQRPNCVDLEAGEAALKAAGRYSELVALYQTKGRHSEALELLHALSQHPEQLPAQPQGASAELRGLPGVWAAVKYVCHLPPAERDLALISTHAKWMLVADPDAGLEMFGSMQPPLPPSAVLPMLTSYAPQLAGTYLEAALVSGAADSATYEQELARIYLERIAAASSTTCSSLDSSAAVTGGRARGGAAAGDAALAGEIEGQTPASLPPEYGKLKQLILSSRHLNYESLLLVVPQQRMLEVRAALLERLGRHLEALRIYIHRLRQLKAAEAYCDRVYQQRQQQRREQRHAELAAALRRQRLATSVATGSGFSGAAAYGVQPPSGTAGAFGSPWGSSGSLRNLQFDGGGGSMAPAGTGGGGRSFIPAGAPATKLQPTLGRGSSEDGADIYLLMVQVLLEEEDSSGTFHHVQHAPDHAVWGEVARLLSRKRDAIQPLHALSLLPGEVPLSNALPFLEGALWGAGERRRAAAVARNLRRSEHVALLGELADARQRSVLLTPERNCSICYKRVGTSALVVFPSGLLAHYSCHRRASGQQAAPGQQASARGGAGGMSNGRTQVGVMGSRSGY